ncbi:hypothetical protein O181_037351 [Austropuccinia psidii MF-1]|uniref:Uncharacterized protein n=1 Tax=Austropuccinia psidii MF-1 TaxID=1389203 RepID=A0A9Q3HAP6_9BASI|nr:hypothetical protein [Austropuccinia psidii MF-1]
MSIKISLTTPIASSINVSGPHIDVGNAMAQTSTTWTISNISLTPIPPNPTNMQMNVSEGPGSTPVISSKAILQSKFTHRFLPNPGQKPVESQETLGKSKQPSLNIPSGSQVHVGHEKLADGDEIYTSLPLFHKEQVTGCHNPYATKMRTGHASSFRERIVDDEDGKMSSNKIGTNGEPGRENLMAHEKGTQANSEFTHTQMPLTQTRLYQSKMRQKRSQACKAHNVAQHVSQKEQKR